MLEVKNISKSFGAKKALDNVNFSIKKGQIAALLGENGAGKSTLLRILSGFYEADSGSISLDKIDLKTERETFLHKIGYVQEISALYGEMKVYEYLQFAANLRRLPAEEVLPQIKKAVAQLELQDVLWQKNETLSKGYKKRVELAATSIQEPCFM